MRKTEKKCIAVIDDEVQMLKVIGRYVTETLKQKNMTDKIINTKKTDTVKVKPSLKLKIS